jgi:hypothetical protein
MKHAALLLALAALACSSGSQVNIHAGTMIVPGRGTDEVSVGMEQEPVVNALGQPEALQNDGKWISYQQTVGIAFRLDNLQKISEIHFYEGFKGRLPSRVQVGSRILDVFKAYGTARERLEVPAGSEGTADRVLYITPAGQRISYNQLGLAFLLSPEKRVTRIIVFQPMPDRTVREKS